MMRTHGFIFPLAQIGAGQTLMLDIVGQFQLPDGQKGLQREQSDAQPAADNLGHHQKRQLQSGVFEHRVGRVPRATATARQHGLFRPPG